MKLIKVEGIEKDVYKLKKDTYYSPDDDTVFVRTDDGFKAMTKAEMKALFAKAKENVEAVKKLVDEVAGKLSGDEKPKKKDDDESEDDGGFF